MLSSRYLWVVLCVSTPVSGARLAMMNDVMMSPVLTQGTQHTTRERGGQNERKFEIKICINFHYNFMWPKSWSDLPLEFIFKSGLNSGGWDDQSLDKYLHSAGRVIWAGANWFESNQESYSIYQQNLRRYKIFFFSRPWCLDFSPPWCKYLFWSILIQRQHAEMTVVDVM